MQLPSPMVAEARQQELDSTQLPSPIAPLVRIQASNFKQLPSKMKAKLFKQALSPTQEPKPTLVVGEAPAKTQALSPLHELGLTVTSSPDQLHAVAPVVVGMQQLLV